MHSVSLYGCPECALNLTPWKLATHLLRPAPGTEPANTAANKSILLSTSARWNEGTRDSMRACHCCCPRAHAASACRMRAMPAPARGCWRPSPASRQSSTSLFGNPLGCASLSLLDTLHPSGTDKQHLAERIIIAALMQPPRQPKCPVGAAVPAPHRRTCSPHAVRGKTLAREIHWQGAPLLLWGACAHFRRGHGGRGATCL